MGRGPRDEDPRGERLLLPLLLLAGGVKPAAAAAAKPMALCQLALLSARSPVVRALFMALGVMRESVTLWRFFLGPTTRLRASSCSGMSLLSSAAAMSFLEDASAWLPGAGLSEGGSGNPKLLEIEATLATKGGGVTEAAIDMGGWLLVTLGPERSRTWGALPTDGVDICCLSVGRGGS